MILIIIYGIGVILSYGRIKASAATLTVVTMPKSTIFFASLLSWVGFLVGLRIWLDFNEPKLLKFRD